MLEIQQAASYLAQAAARVKSGGDKLGMAYGAPLRRS